ncbi:TIGR03086 family metal-binding protein [Phytoactinopolyspora mesophila]|uniref:TIGR03086 family protein n=1 Tax=Phytoactinopolyspora mesophila TaxID=2650750 RepID=A0A7K3LZK3_9ACTN|nr:TIGR03086 family metal-binding protein [Phytoactinopolyspora mesophila]NDL56420.1 TIGR03086 family protein [Phytoactinopolyspora mesophila]
MIDFQAAHPHAVQLTVDAVRSVSTDQLTNPTPCADWDLSLLLDHMTVQNLGFAAAAAGNGTDDAVWVTAGRRADPVADYLASATVVTQAFAEPGVVDRAFSLPELSRDRTFTGSQAIAMHTVDSLVHAWDVARSIGHDIHPDPDLIEATLALVEQIPDDETRRQPGAHFAPRLAVPSQASAFDRVLALLGRAPHWSPA